MLSARNINDGQISFDDIRWITNEDFAVEDARTRIGTGDVLLTIVGTIGRTAVVPASACPFALQRSVAVLKPVTVDSRYLAYCLESPIQQRWLAENAKGTAQKGVYLKTLGTASIPIAPEAEQTRIVEKLEELLSDLDAGVAELKAAQAKLAQYRQSLLKAAVAGALTADWRAARESVRPEPVEGRPSSTHASTSAARTDKGETGAALLARILTERRTRWETRQLAKYAEQGKTPPKGWQAKYSEPVAPDTTDLPELPELPEGWVWASLDALVAESSYGTSVKCSYESDETPVLRIPNVSGGKLDLRDMKRSIQALPLDEGDYLTIGDILVIRTNGSIGLVGRAAAVTEILPAPHYFASYLLRLRCVSQIYLYRWISSVLAAPTGRQWLEARAASSAGQHNISLSTLLTMPVPLPPMAEQTRALELLASNMEPCDEQEEAVKRSLNQAAAQRKNLLKAAFAGQLVPQDPADEPASALLARIRAERVAAGTISGKRGRKKKKDAP